MKRKTKQTIVITLSILCIMAFAVAGYLYFTVPRLYFHNEIETVEINATYKPENFISSIDNADKEDIKIKDNVNIKKLGTYTIEYQIDDTSFTLTCKVVDTKKPEVIFQDAKVSLHEKPDASIFVKKISDATKTSVSFKDTITYDSLGDRRVVVEVRDEAGNLTQQNVTVHVLEKDKTPPVIHGAYDFSVQAGTNIDLKKGIYANDDRDGSVKVSVDKGKLDTKKAGSYDIKYTAIDRAKNKTVKTITITVMGKSSTSTTEKVIYLTIDDGPSANTVKILDILDRYNVKATFFVTAQSPSYLKYIKIAYQKGHAIGLHTYSHDYASLYASEAAYFKDLTKISNVVKQQTGQSPTIIRFPGGSSNTISSNVRGLMTRLTKAVQDKGYQYYDWNSESGDGNSALPSSRLITTAKSFGGSGPLMMLTHDHSGSNASVQALPSIIEYYKGLGYTFKTVNSSVPGYHHGVNN